MKRAICACVFALLLIPSHAHASFSSGGLHYVTEHHAAPANVATGTARCGPGTHVVGGGEATPSDFSANSHTLLHSYPFDASDVDKAPDDGWKVRVQTSRSFKTYAVCAPFRPAYERAKIHLQMGQATEVDATGCTDTASVLGGGTRGPDDTVAVQSYPVDGATTDAWAVEVENHTVAEEPLVRLYAICADVSATYPTDNGVPLSAGVGLAGPTCSAPNAHVVAGGQSNTAGYGQITVNHSYPQASDSWEIATNGVSAFTGYAVCVPKVGRKAAR